MADSPRHPSSVTRAPAIPRSTVIGARVAGSSLRVQQYRLCVERGGPVGDVYDVGEGETRIGKAPDNQIVIDHPTVSRNHFAIVREGDRYLLRDLGSTNGTFLDGSHVREAFLKAGALIEAGDVQLRFVPEQIPVEIAPSASPRFGGLVGESLRMRELFALLERVAKIDASVVIQGETGTGKGTVAAAIHEHSPHAKRPFVVFDCASVSKTLIESELFGHERGAFTGAVSQHAGFLEQSVGGTLFIDQIEDLDLDLQPKLLRALEERVFRRVGGSGALRFDARVIAASRKDLRAEVAAGRFREDLYFRLSVFVLGLPALRDRREDIPVLADNFAGRAVWEGWPPEVQGLFRNHPWPGNLRELRNAVERAEALAALGGSLDAEGLLQTTEAQTRKTPPPMPELRVAAPSPQGAETLPVSFGGSFKEAKDQLVSAFEREYLRRLLLRCQGNVARAAREADVDRKHLYSLLKKYGLSGA
ncbi:MAG: sigma 54-interacting transcriptional regulator [Myxococcales bacterium]